MKEQEILKPLKTLHFAMFGVILLVMVVFTLVLRDPGTIGMDLTLDALVILGGVLTVMAMLASKWLPAPKFDRALSQLSNEELIQVRGRYIRLWALIEGAALINLMLFFVSNNGIFVVCAIILVVLLYFQRPVSNQH